MSDLGQTEKNSLRANVFRVTPESGHCFMQSACLKCARTRTSAERMVARRVWSSAPTRPAVSDNARQVLTGHSLFTEKPCSGTLRFR